MCAFQGSTGATSGLLLGGTPEKVLVHVVTGLLDGEILEET